MSNTNQIALRLPHAPDATTVELLYRTFGDVLIPLDKVRVQYFRNLNEEAGTREHRNQSKPLPLRSAKFVLSTRKKQKVSAAKQQALFPLSATPPRD